MKYTVVSATYGPMKTFDNEHDAESAMNSYNWANDNDAAYIDKEEETMTTTTAKIGDQIKVNGTTYTIAKIFYADYYGNDGWMIEFTDTNGGYHYWKQYLDGGEFIPAAEDTTTTNNKEEETMKSTNVKIDLSTGIIKFELNGVTYTANPDTKRYSKTTADGKTKRISYVEYNKAHFDLQKSKQTADNEQAELDKEPCHVDRVTIECDFDGDTRFWTVRVNGKAVSNHYSYDEAKAEAAKLGELEEPDEAQDPELEQIMEETGLEASDAELERNIRNEQKKPSKPRRSKDVAYEGHGKTLTAKQVDFLRELRKTGVFDMDGDMVVEEITITIGGQFEDKPMTVGAMISTLCEKHLGTRIKAKVEKRTVTVFGLTPNGKEIVKELGLE